MKLQDKHKEYVVESFARYMKLTDIVEAFITDFTDELPQPELPEPPDIDKLMEAPLSNMEIVHKLGYISEHCENYEDRFVEEYGENAEEKLKESALEDYNEDRKDSYLSDYQEEREAAIQAHEESLKQELFNQFRRFDIRHRQFPKKYRSLFQKSREDYFASYREKSLSTPENRNTELETLYGYVENLIFEEDNPRRRVEHIRLANQLLKTIAINNAINQQKEPVDIIPQDPTALQAPTKTLTAPPGKEAKRLTEHTEKQNGQNTKP